MPSPAYLDAFRQQMAAGGQPYAVPAPTFAPAPAVSPFVAELRAGVAPQPSATGPTALADASGVGSGPPTVENARPAPPPVLDVPAGSVSQAPPVEAGGSSQIPAPPPVMKSDPTDGGVSVPPPMVSTPPAVVAEPVSTPAVQQRQHLTLADVDAAGAPAVPGRTVDPEVAATDARLADIGAYARRETPGRRIAAHWQGAERSVEGKMIDPEARAEYDAAQLAQQQAAAQVGGFRAQIAEEQRQLEASKGDVRAMAGAQAAEAGKTFAAEQAKIEADLTEQRRKLSNPADYWEGKNSAYRIGMALSTVLEGALQGAAGVKIEPGKVLDAAIKDHVDAQMRKLGFIEQKRGESKEKFAQQSAARAGALQAALGAVDDQIKDAEARGKNPIVQELIVEQKLGEPVKEEEGNALDRIARKLVLKAQAEGHRLMPEVISGPEPAMPTPIIRTLREQARYLAPELEAAERRLAAAREKLALEEKLASTRKESEKFKEATTVGGKKRDLATELAVEKARRENREGNRELNVKEQDANTRAGTEVAKAKDAQGMRTVYVKDADGKPVPYITDARGESELKGVRDQFTQLDTIQPALADLRRDAADITPKMTPQTRARLVQQATQAYETLSVTLGQGVLNKAGYDSAEKFANGYIGGGAGAVEAMQMIVDAKKSALIAQHGLRQAPAGGR